MRHVKLSKKGFKNLLSLFILLTIITALLGCSGSYGLIQRSREVGRIFERVEILPDHNYYYSGPDAIPYAIIGIHKNYTLKTRYWKKVNLTEQKLRMWLNLGMQSRGLIGMPPNGSYIYGPEKEQIGVWYSIFSGTVVKMLGNNEVEVHPPISYPGNKVRPDMERGSLKLKENGKGKLISFAAP